ncbi:hypothetical protein [Streptomyces sp. NBC_01216]|uniref:hypothetical protein n=1 Tax=unclassified Streptomyces TaxID=2593676 RepID=UPI002E0DE70E|nr:hypothetical protein OG393_04460 [Streptomyces sp. NBC_01216]
MSPAPAHRAAPAAPAAPAAGAVCPDPGTRRVPRAASRTAGLRRARRVGLILGLVLAALLGAGGGAAGAVAGEQRPAASAVPDPGGETFEVSETEATAPRRAVPRHRGAHRPTRRPAPPGGAPAAGAPTRVPLPEGDAARRCVVMRC